MRNHIPTMRLLAPTMLLMLAGCFKLARESPQLHQYVLSGESQPGTLTNTVTGAAGSPSTPASVGLNLGLRRMDLASYLSMPSVVVRRGINQLVVSDFHRWGESLGEGINRVVAANLASTSTVQAVDVAPWPARAQHDYLLQLHVSRFDGTADSAATQGGIHVLVGWDIIRPINGAVLVRGRTDDRGGSWRVGDYAGLVKELDAALVRLARDISGCLSRFTNDSTPPASCESVADGADKARN